MTDRSEHDPVPDATTEGSGLSRRDFMRSGAAVASAGALAAGGLLTSPDGWAASLKVLDAAEAKTLLRMTRDLYPHDRLDDSIYMQAIDGLDASAATDSALAQMLAEGVRELNAAARRVGNADYVKLTRESDRVAALQKIESTAFFQKVRGTLITGIYNRPDVWKQLGYEGPSAHLGGYLARGFDDLDWL
ncbi:MAG: gluconate 2-dehydrogenase subunit 3 family protein [Burkholderiales bacterium]|nr:gluconate 2-dehydrogenase subunit 3 family protein [Burkholderiales bacterium]